MPPSGGFLCYTDCSCSTVMARLLYPGAKEDAISMLRHGLSYSEIADEISCGCSVDMVKDWVHQHDWSMAKVVVARGFTRTSTDRSSVSPAELEAMTMIYYTARILTRETGEPYEVDHIVEICEGGQHVIENLRIVPRHANRRGPKKKI